MGEWRVEVLFLMEDDDEREEDHALNIAERIGDVVKSSSLEVLQHFVTKEF